MAKHILFTLIIALACSNAFGAITFDWKGSSSTTWESSASWTETGGTGDYPGSGGRTTDIVRFAVSGSTFSKQPILTTSLTVASIEFGSVQAAGTQLTVNGATLTVTTITQDVNTISGSNTIYDYFYGTGTITCTNIIVGTPSKNNGNFNYMMDDIATLNVTGNITIIENVNKPQGSGFRLENGSLYLSGQILFTVTSGVTASNSTYFTINTITQATPQTATTPHLYLSNASPVGSIPTPNASVNFYGDHGGTSTVTYTAASPNIVTTSTGGFGTGGGTIDTSKTQYDYLTIQGSGTATVGGGTSTLGALKVAADLITASNTTFNTSAGTNTSVGGNWTNSATVTMGTGSTAITGNITNSGPLTLSSGILEVGGSVTNSSTLKAGSGNITIDGSLSTSSNLTLSSGNLTVGGNYTNTQIFKAGTGTVIFNGASAQALADNSFSGTTFNNVNFNGGGTKTMSGTGSFAVSSSGVATMGSGTMLASGGILTLNSDATGSATVAAVPSNSAINGSVKVQRYISGGTNAYRGYRLLSSPVYSASSGGNYYYNLSYLATYAPLTGTLGTGGGMTKTGNPTIYLYRDNVVFTNATFNTGNFRGVNKINNAPTYSIGVDYDGSFNLHPGTGIMFFYRGNLSNIATKYITTTVAETNTFTQTGTLNQQAIPVINWYTQTTALQHDVVAANPAAYAGFNLVGNPYASSIDWSKYSTTTSTAGIYAPNVGPTIWVFNVLRKTYSTYNKSNGLTANGGSSIITSGQGFFVQTTAAGASLTFNESAKTNTQLTGPMAATGTTISLDAIPVPTASTHVNAAPQYMRLQLYADSITNEDAVIALNQSGTTKFSYDEDSPFLPGSSSVSLSSRSSDSIKLAINTIPYPGRTSPIVVPLSVNATVARQYSLNVTEFKNIPQLFDVWLKDANTGDSLDMRNNQSYAFNINFADSTSYGANRFSVVIRQNTARALHLLSFTGSKTFDGASLNWKTENEYNYTTFTVQRSNDDGATFTDLATVTSDSRGAYSYMDKKPLKGKNEYRIKITDITGDVSYSQAVTLNFGTQDNDVEISKISVFPNPAVYAINVTIIPDTKGPSTTKKSTSYDIKIMSTSGFVVKSGTTSQLTWLGNVGNLLPGTYIVEVINNQDKTVVGKSKFVKL